MMGMTDQGADSGRADLVRSSDGRQETDIQRLDRQWNDLLQELRVVQTGVQLLTGLLLTLPFQPRFDQLAPLARGVYLFTVVTAVTASVLLIAPVAMHRALFGGTCVTGGFGYVNPKAGIDVFLVQQVDGGTDTRVGFAIKMFVR